MHWGGNQTLDRTCGVDNACKHLSLLGNLIAHYVPDHRSVLACHAEVSEQLKVTQSYRKSSQGWLPVTASQLSSNLSITNPHTIDRAGQKGVKTNCTLIKLTNTRKYKHTKGYNM